MLNEISQFINSLPEYIGQGIIGLLVTVAAGLVLAYMTSRFFMRKDELTRIEGLLLEKKIPIYKEIFVRVESLNNLVEYTPSKCRMALDGIKECGFTPPSHLHSPQVFEDADTMRDTFLSLDQYVTENKIFFDDHIASAMLVFQNYITLYVRFQALFREQMEDFNVPLNDKVKAIEHQMFVALGLILCEDFFLQTQNVTGAIRDSFNNLSFEHRVAPTYRYEDFNDPESGLFKELLKTKALAEKDKIQNLIMHFTSLALIAGGNIER